MYTAETDNLKGLGRDMINFLEDINIATLCVYLLMDFKFFGSLLLNKSKQKVLLESTKLFATIRKFLAIIDKALQRPYSGDFDLENAYKKPHVIL